MTDRLLAGTLLRTFAPGGVISGAEIGLDEPVRLHVEWVRVNTLAGNTASFIRGSLVLARVPSGDWDVDWDIGPGESIYIQQQGHALGGPTITPVLAGVTVTCRIRVMYEDAK